MDESTARLEIHEFITERWTEFCDQLMEKGYDHDCCHSEELDTLIDDILINQ